MCSARPGRDRSQEHPWRPSAFAPAALRTIPTHAPRGLWPLAQGRRPHRPPRRRLGRPPHCGQRLESLHPQGQAEEGPDHRGGRRGGRISRIHAGARPLARPPSPNRKSSVPDLPARLFSSELAASRAVAELEPPDGVCENDAEDRPAPPAASRAV